jgi:hypothetical protein
VYKPKPTRGEGGESGSSNFMENWAQRDLCITPSPQGERGEFFIFPPLPSWERGGTGGEGDSLCLLRDAPKPPAGTQHLQCRWQISINSTSGAELKQSQNYHIISPLAQQKVGCVPRHPFEHTTLCGLALAKHRHRGRCVPRLRDFPTQIRDALRRNAPYNYAPYWKKTPRRKHQSQDFRSDT